MRHLSLDRIRDMAEGEGRDIGEVAKDIAEDEGMSLSDFIDDLADREGIETSEVRKELGLVEERPPTPEEPPPVKPSRTRR